MTVRRIVITGAAALAACGVLGMTPAAVQASSASPATWTQQAPAVHPTARIAMAMAYDAATGTAVLFGGCGCPQRVRYLGDTWTWDGTTWTKQAPPVHPPARVLASMAYDAATGTVVLFGGTGSHGDLADTWTWDGTTWTKQAPAVHPPARSGASMAYDAATGIVVLFGGSGSHGDLADTWTWDGTTWTKQAPAVHPPSRVLASMAYDAATGTVVLFGGDGRSATGKLGDTWTWDGTTWTKQAPAVHPPSRDLASMAYDAATGTAVLFGGTRSHGDLADTWTWDGTTWTKQAPATSPPARAEGAMAYDAATGTAVLFGGYHYTSRGLVHDLADTWTWG